MRPRVLIIDGDEAARRELERGLPEGSELFVARSSGEALLAVGRLRPHLATFDPGALGESGNGGDRLLLLSKLRRLAPSLKVIVVAGDESREEAARAIELGAFDYCVKPIDPREFSFLVRRALRIQELEEAACVAPEAVPSGEEPGGIVCACEAMRDVVSLARRTAATDAAVLLVGEPGTGKELIARTIHRLSGRRDGPFVSSDASAVPEARLGAELFGDGGAPDDGRDAGPGALDRAHRGTLFIRDVCRIPLPLQARLCAFLEGRRGSDRDVRVVASSSHALHADVRTGAFRDDLLYRLGVVTIAVPPLRERGEDVLLLAAATLDRFLASERQTAARFTRSALRAITAHGWPGNIPEMESRVARAVALARGERITARDLGLDDVGASPERTLREARDELERAMAAAALRLAAGNVSRAARSIGVARPTMYDLIRKHGLVLASFKAPERA